MALRNFLHVPILLALATMVAAKPVLDQSRAALLAGDTERARVLLEPLAAAGDREACYQLGLSQSARKPVPDDAVAALRCAAEQHDAGAQYLLALALAHRGDPEAEQWFRSAATAGHDLAVARGTTTADGMTGGNGSLVVAARRGDLGAARAALDSGQPADDDGKTGITPLRWALLNHHRDMVHLLVEHGADIDRRDAAGETALLAATRAGNRDDVATLLSLGADANLSDRDGNTPLHLAAARDAADLAGALVRGGALTDRANARGETPVALARARQHTEVLAALGSSRADAPTSPDPAPKAPGKAYANWLPLQLAAWHGNADRVRTLLDQGSAIDAIDFEGRTALARAAMQGNDAVCRLLLDRGASVDHAAAASATPLQLALHHRRWATATLLLDHGAQTAAAGTGLPEPLLLAIDGGNDSLAARLAANAGVDQYAPALLAAATAGLPSTSAALLQQGASPDIADAYSRSPLWLAVAGNHIDTARALLQYHAGLEAADHNGLTPLAVAASRGHDAMVSLLLTQGARVDAATAGGNTPLALAAYRGHAGVIGQLLTAGADAEHRNANTATPLMLAAASGSAPAVDALLAAGADPSRRDQQRRTTADYAAAAGYEPLAATLRDAAAGRSLKVFPTGR